MEYTVTYIDRESSEVEEKHECNWQSEINVIVANGLEKNYAVIIEKNKET